MPRRRSKSKSGVVSVNFDGVSTGGGGRIIPEDRYLFELVEVKEDESQDGNPYLACQFEVAEGKYEGTKVYDNFSLQPQALWKLRSFLEGAGYETEDGEMDLVLDELEGLMVYSDIIHEEYRGKTKNRLDGFFKADEESEEAEEEEAEEEEEEEPPKKTTRKKRASKKAPPPEEEEEEEEEEGWFEGQKVAFKDGRKRLVGKITEASEDVVTVKVGRDEYEVDPADLEEA